MRVAAPPGAAPLGVVEGEAEAADSGGELTWMDSESWQLTEEAEEGGWGGDGEGGHDDGGVGMDLWGFDALDEEDAGEGADAAWRDG